MTSILKALGKECGMRRMLVKLGIFALLLNLSTQQQRVPSPTSASASAASDRRCLLRNGASTETFFVRESLPLGGQVGRVDVVGVVGEDVELRLQDETAVVQLQSEDSNVLVLRRQLDKENVDGPDKANVRILCKRTNSDDPVFIIPVRIRTTDVNDHAPVFVDAPYSLNVSELTLVGTRIFDQIVAKDADQPGPFSTVEYRVLDSEYVAFSNPLDPQSLLLSKKLDFESHASITVDIEARDRGSPPRVNETQLVLHVVDADDQNPKFEFDYYEAVLPSETSERLRVRPKEMRAFDQDKGLNAPLFYSLSASASVEAVAKYVELNRHTGHVFLKASIPDDLLLQPATLVIKATQFDNPDRYALTTLSVRREGNLFDSKLNFEKNVYHVNVLENVPLNSVIITLVTNRAPFDARVRLQILDGANDVFSIDQRGRITVRKVLDYENRRAYSLRVLASDGRENSSCRVDVNVVNINDWDPRFKYNHYEFFVGVEDAFDDFVLGQLDVHDGDKGDDVTLTLRQSPQARAFTLNAKKQLVLVDVKQLNTSEIHLVVAAEDSGIPPRHASVPVVVRISPAVLASRQINNREGLVVANPLMIVSVFVVVVSLVFIVALLLFVCLCKKKTRTMDNNLDNSMGNAVANKSHGHYFHTDFLQLPPARHLADNLENNAIFNPELYGTRPHFINPLGHGNRNNENNEGNHRVVNRPGSNSNLPTLASMNQSGLPTPRLPTPGPELMRPMSVELAAPLVEGSRATLKSRAKLPSRISVTRLPSTSPLPPVATTSRALSSSSSSKVSKLAAWEEAFELSCDRDLSTLTHNDAESARRRLRNNAADSEPHLPSVANTDIRQWEHRDRHNRGYDLRVQSALYL